MTSQKQQDTPQLSTESTTTTPTYDFVCIGFGPAQIATAIANREARKPSRVLYLERKQSFSWFSDTHLARTRMKNPFVYDLATVRNPRSAFSYVNYLLARKRLIEFANSDRLNPLRIEFEDYLRWCAEQFKEQVRYGSEAVEVVPELQDDVVRAWRVAVRDSNGNVSVVRAKVVGAPSPASDNTPQQQSLTSFDFLAEQRIISMDDYLTRRNDLRGVNEPRLDIVVVGSGRQITEILDDLLSCPRLGNVTVVTEDQSLVPLRILGEKEPPQPRLCSIWAKPSGDQQGAVTDASHLVQTIYMRAYEKQVASRGQYGLRVIVGKDAAKACSKASIIIRDTTPSPMPSTEMLQSLDSLVLGCRSKGDGLEEVVFKRGVAAEGCRVFLMSAHSEFGRSLAKDVAITAGQIVKALSPVPAERRNGVVAQARM